MGEIVRQTDRQMEMVALCIAVLCWRSTASLGCRTRAVPRAWCCTQRWTTTLSDTDWRRLTLRWSTCSQAHWEPVWEPGELPSLTGPPDRKKIIFLRDRGALRHCGPGVAYPLTSSQRPCVQLRVEDEVPEGSTLIFGDTRISFQHNVGPSERWLLRQNLLDPFRRFDRTPACNGQTDRQT